MSKDMAFCHLLKNLEIYRCCKTASKIVVQKTAEAADFIGNKIADKIISADKAKNKGKEEDNEVNKILEIYIPPEKCQQIPEKVPEYITKKWIKVHDQSGNANDRYKPSKQIRFKISMLQSGLCDYSNEYIVVKRKIGL